MTNNLERRLARDVFHYCLLDSQFYEDFNRYAPSEMAYRDLVAALLPNSWVIRSERLWYTAFLPDVSLPAQGFKIHLSAITATAGTLLRRVVPILASEGAAFKFAADPPMLDYLNSKNVARGSSGKFITIYPSDEEQCKTLLGSLHAATEDMKGPHILSDRSFNGSKVVFYRYGGFSRRSQLTLYGDRPPVILGPDGEPMPDSRGPAFQLPLGMSDPFQPSPAPVPPPTPLLNGRFAVESAESFSNAGGVYKGRDTATGARVLIKEARPGTCTLNGSPRDSTHTLAKEYRVLLALQLTGYVPAALDYFEEWDHHFLVEEFFDGTLLSSYRAREGVALISDRTGAADLVDTFCERLWLITRKLIDAVEACHEKGIVLGDISPSNILIDDNSLAVRLIDFESATILQEGNDSEHVVIGTPGFISPSRSRGAQVTFADDWYSLGAVIYSFIFPVQQFFSLHPKAQSHFLREIIKDQSLPGEVCDLISALFKGDVARAKEIVASGFSFPDSEAEPDELPTSAELEEIVKGIKSHILATEDTLREDRLFPSDYRIFSTNPLSISYGAIGQVLYLKSTLGIIPEDVRDWVLRQPITLENYAPGLYVGLSGLAWGLAELGFEDAAHKAINEAYQSPLLYESLDVFYGCAGTGLASLHWWYRTGEDKFLARASELGDQILGAAIDDPAGHYWLNVDGNHHFGYAHGGSGISLFLLYLYLANQDPKYLQYAISGLEYEIAQGREKAGYIAWTRSKDSGIFSPYWRYGNAGIGSVLIRFYAILKSQRYLEFADKAARYAAGKFAGFPGQFMGLSGIGEFLLDMYRFTGDQKYIHEAQRVASGVLLYAVPKPHGTAFPGEELIRLSTDYGTGSAGIGMFLQRLLRPADRLFHDLRLDHLAVGREGLRSLVEVQSLDNLCARY
jgi:serine/threonine protein kinase